LSWVDDCKMLHRSHRKRDYLYYAAPRSLFTVFTVSAASIVTAISSAERAAWIFILEADSRSKQPVYRWSGLSMHIYHLEAPVKPLQSNRFSTLTLHPSFDSDARLSAPPRKLFVTVARPCGQAQEWVASLRVLSVRGFAGEVVPEQSVWDDLSAKVHSETGKRELQVLRSTYLEVKAKLDALSKVIE
jgi:hypothetical protein